MNPSSDITACLIIVKNGDETSVSKSCIAEEQNRYYSETLVIHIMCVRESYAFQESKSNTAFFLYSLENVCKKIVFHCIGFDTVKLVIKLVSTLAIFLGGWAILLIEIF